MSSESQADALKLALERLRRGGGTLADIDQLAAVLNQRSVVVAAARGVGIGTAQDSVIITGDNAEYRSVELTFNGPQAGTIRMAIGRARLQNAIKGGTAQGKENLPRVPVGSPLILLIGIFFSAGSFFSFISFANDVGVIIALPLLIPFAIGAGLLVDGVRRIRNYRASPIRSLPCQVADKRENGTVGYYLSLEDVDQNRHQIDATRKHGEAIAVGDVGLAEIRSRQLVNFSRFDLGEAETTS